MKAWWICTNQPLQQGPILGFGWVGGLVLHLLNLTWRQISKKQKFYLYLLESKDAIENV